MESDQDSVRRRKKVCIKKVYKNPSYYKFNCECGKNFNYKKHYNDHRRKVHQDLNCSRKDTPVKPEKGCPSCDFKSRFRDQMMDHFQASHNIILEKEKLSFTTKEDFMLWKYRIEQQTASKFICEFGSQAFRKHIITKYTCHRSGYYIPHKKKGLRHLKKQGSVKINGFCPASVTLQLQNNGSCIVNYISTHVGHDNNLKYLWLTSSERETIAKKLALKIPFDEILDSIRDQGNQVSVQRIHLLTRKDLYNIQASFNLTSKAVKRKNDSQCIDAWVKQVQNDGDCVVYYKPQGVYLEESPDLSAEDLVLITMFDVQLDLLQRYGHDCICLNGTHGANSFDFELVTLMILDELHEGFPCAFLISNRKDINVLSIFFNKIKLKTGIIKPKIFISDWDDTYFNAWSIIMGVPEKRLYCTWHIDHCWRTNLPKIGTKQIQVTIYKHLRTLLTERDVNTFQKMLIQFCHIDDPECIEFITYFRNNFLNNSEYWAHCHRLNAGINTNMHLERMHESINFIYLKETRIDKGIAAIIKFVREKLIDLMRVNEKGKISVKIANIKERHKSMEEMEDITLKTFEHGWEVSSANNHEMYLVQKQEATCQDCKLSCTDCGVCIHQFVCTCLDSAIKYNMCKHIHLVARNVYQSNVDEPLLDMEDIINVNDDDGTQCDNILGELNTHSKIPNLDNRKEILIKSVIDAVNTISSIEELGVVENKFSDAMLMLETMRSSMPESGKELTTVKTEIDLEQQLQEHKIKKHYMITNNSSRPFVCSVCMKGFKRVGYLHSHVITHSAEKKVICEECGKGFYRKDQLKKHSRFHKTRQKKEEANITQQIFPKEHLLDNNIRTTHFTITVEETFTGDFVHRGIQTGT
ncbi:uncharacterized protein [Diabrotica undecimpunctata]|uniref:uncharacterized protein isoform X3 n=1 Tax=Diabrotica undecimpunctata TaxID=50387 RepID=UPI003B6324C7